MRCSTSQMYVDNDLLNCKALMLKKTHSLISLLTVSDNAIKKKLFLITWMQERKHGPFVLNRNIPTFVVYINICIVIYLFYS